MHLIDGNPLTWYTDPSIMEAEFDRLFRGSWQYVGHVSKLDEPGSYITQFLGGRIPVVALRGLDGALRGFLNACRHRAARLVEGEGQKRRLTCPYHAWSYDLDGSLIAAPKCIALTDFNKADHALIPVAVDCWGPLVFVNTNPAPTIGLAEWLGPLPAHLARHGIDPAAMDYHSRVKEEDFLANWKLVVENWPECYHCSPTHPTLFKVLDLSSKAETRVVGRHVAIVSNNAAPAMLAGPYGQDAGAGYNPKGPITEGMYGVIFPNTVIGVSPGQPNLTVSTLIPLSIDRTGLVTDTFTGPSVTDTWLEGLMNWYEIVGTEDDHALRALQQGAGAGRAQQNRIVMPHEETVAAFQRWVREGLAAVVADTSNTPQT